MKIAVEATYLLERNKTGVENYTYFLLAAMAKLEGNHELHLFLPRAPRREEADLVEVFSASARCHFHIVPKLRLWLKLWMPLAARRRGAEVGLFPGGILPWYLPFPSVMIVHDLCWSVYPECYPKREIHIFRDIYPRSLAAAKLIFTGSEFSRGDITRVYGTPPEKIRVIPHGRDLSFAPAPQAPQQVWEKWGLEEGYLLAIGTAHPRKDIATLLRAYAILSPIDRRPPLVLIGPSGPTSAPLKELSEELGISEQIRWLNYVARKDLPALLSAAGVFVMPSVYEGFGMPVLEAMQCGAPVICSNATSLPEAGGEAALLVEPRRPDLLAETMQKVLADKILAAQMREKGFQQVLKFDWTRSAQRALSYLREACAR